MDSAQGRTVLVTGAAGFIGEALVRALAARTDVARVYAADLVAAPVFHPKVAPLLGDLANAAFARDLLPPDADTVFHLASLVSGGAELDYQLGMKVNFDATRELLDAVRRAARAPVFVFASSIAVYGATRGGEPLHVDDDTRPAPRLAYGTQKLMCELLIDELARRGAVDGRSLRLPTVMVRPGSANTAVSGWASALVREPLAGRAYTCPVTRRTVMACISLGKVVQALLHAAELPATAFGASRSVLLEGLPASAQEMLAAVQAFGGERRLGQVDFMPDPDLQTLIDGLPRSTHSARAAALGFARSASIHEIVAEYIAGLG